jgi:hypothetical protein
MSSYSLLGNSCSSRTSAKTSNRKFLLPDSQVYRIPYTMMWEYPGREAPSGLIDLTEGNYHESKHSFQGKFAGPHTQMQGIGLGHDSEIHNHIKSGGSGCKSCSRS